MEAVHKVGFVSIPYIIRAWAALLLAVPSLVVANPSFDLAIEVSKHRDWLLAVSTSLVVLVASHSIELAHLHKGFGGASQDQ